MKKILAIVLLFTLFMSCDTSPSRSSCDFIFFEKTSGFIIPDDVQIIDCYDSLEGTAWVRLKLNQVGIQKMIQELKMTAYSAEQGDLADWNYDVHGSRDDQTLEYIKMFVKDSAYFVKNKNHLFLVAISKPNQYVNYIIDQQTGDFIGLIDYPDWSGDF